MGVPDLTVEQAIFDAMWARTLSIVLQFHAEDASSMGQAIGGMLKNLVIHDYRRDAEAAKTA
jgi:hypothetical protein